MIAAADSNAPGSHEALEALCQTYWFPVYCYVRRVAKRTEDAQDSTQAFFAHLLEKGALSKADPQRGKFRTFLLAALRNFLANERDHAQTQKRGGGIAPLRLDLEAGQARYALEPCHELTPERQFERRYALALLEEVLRRVQSELTAAGKPLQFEHLKEAITGEMTQAQYDRAARALGTTAAAAKQAAYRLRKRYRELFCSEVARTVGSETELDEEITGLLDALGK